MSPEPWKRNFYVMFIVEFIVILGFSFVIPFLPLYIQQLGNFDNEQAAFWSGIAGSVAGFAMFVSAPFWGIMADRWGRKPMVLRSMFGGGITIALMGFIPNLWAVIILRFFQGLLSGTVAAASALVASSTPRDKMPYVMGLLMVAVQGGNSFGPLLGGVLADKLGFVNTFLLTGGIVSLGGLIVLFFVKENFTPPPKEEIATPGKMWQLVKSKELLPVLAITFAMSAGPSIISPILTLYISERSPAGSAESISGTAYFLLGVITTLSSLAASRLGGRFDLKTILIFSCISTGLLFLPPILAVNATQVMILIALTGLLRGGMITTPSALVGLVTPIAMQGIAYGVNQSVSSLGGAIGPFIGGALATAIGFKGVFVVTAVAYVLTGLLVIILLRHVNIGKTTSVKNNSSIR
jgi:DHA1 family multidrug resistance protein-like MFS transporter